MRSTISAQSFVQTSFGQPVLTGETTALSVTRMLDAIRIVNPRFNFIKRVLARCLAMLKCLKQNPLRSTHKPLRRCESIWPLDNCQLLAAIIMLLAAYFLIMKVQDVA